MSFLCFFLNDSEEIIIWFGIIDLRSLFSVLEKIEIFIFVGGRKVGKNCVVFIIKRVSCVFLEYGVFIWEGWEG